MMFTLTIVSVMIVVVMALILVIAVLVEMFGGLAGLNVHMGHAISGMAMPDGEAQSWCRRGIQKQAIAGRCDPENAAPASSRFKPGSQSA